MNLLHKKTSEKASKVA